MLTKDQIKNKLREDSTWEPDANATEEEWDTYYEALDEMDSEMLEEDNDEKVKLKQSSVEGSNTDDDIDTWDEYKDSDDDDDDWGDDDDDDDDEDNDNW